MLQCCQIAAEAGHPEHGQSRLPGSEEITGATQAQVFFCNFKAIGCAAQGFEPGKRIGIFGLGYQYAIALRASSAYTAPELVQLGKSKPIRILHNHQCRIGHVHTHLNDRGRHQNIRFLFGKGCHNLFFFAALHLSVEQGNL